MSKVFLLVVVIELKRNLVEEQDVDKYMKGSKGSKKGAKVAFKLIHNDEGFRLAIQEWFIERRVSDMPNIIFIRARSDGKPVPVDDN